MNFSVTKNGKTLSKELYDWNEETLVFSSNEDNLVLDFSDCDSVTFKTGNDCTFKTGSNCTFDTGSDCTFNTGSDCVFNTGSDCTFDTLSGCTFKTGDGCTFSTISYCTFNTGYDCTFKTGSDCVIVRRDVFEVIQVPENEVIKLNSYNVKGYEVITEPAIEISVKINGKECSLKDISTETLNKLKELS